jgi:hypothetical protein
MQRLASWEAVQEPEPGVRDGLVAAAAVVVGVALVVPVLSHTWPPSLLPAPTGRLDWAFNVRLLKALLLLEGLGLVGLGLLIAARGGWARRLGGVAVLEAQPGVALALLCILHAAALVFFLPPQQIVSEQPVHTGSHAANYYRIFAAHRLLSDGGRLWGYDPFFMAGYPAGAVFDPDTRGSELFVHAFSFLGLPYASKAYILLVELAPPLLVFAAARLAGLRSGAALLAALLATVHWHWGRPFLGYLRWAGMHSYLLAAQLALLGTGLAVRFFDPDHRVRVLSWLGLVGVAALVGFVHPEGLLLLAPGVVLASALGWRRLRRRDTAALGLGLLLLVALHSTWIVPLVRYRHLLAPPTPGMQLHGPADFLEILLRPTSGLVGATLLLGAAGCWRLRRDLPLAAWALGGAGAGLLAVTAWGAQLGPLRRLETARSLVPASLLLAVPAGAALHAGLHRVQRATGGTLVLAALLVSGTAPAFLSLLDTGFFYAHRLDATLDGRATELLRRLDALAPRDARILFESTSAEAAGTDGVALQALVPIYTRRELLGGPQPDMLPLQGRFDFAAGALAGRSLATWSAAEFAALLERYNVGAVVAWSPAARAFLAAQSGVLAPAATLHGFEIYTATRPSTYLLAGRGRVRADYNRLEVSEARGEELILKYHWTDGLQATPAVPIERAVVPDDPVGFIRVRPGGETRFVLRPGR